MQDCFEQASNAYQYGDKSEARYYSQQGHEHKDRRDALNAEISELAREVKQAKANAEASAPRISSYAFDSAKSAFESAKARHESAQAEFKRLKAQRDSAKAEFDRLQAQFKQAQKPTEFDPFLPTKYSKGWHLLSAFSFYGIIAICIYRNQNENELCLRMVAKILLKVTITR